MVDQSGGRAARQGCQGNGWGVVGALVVVMGVLGCGEAKEAEVVRGVYEWRQMVEVAGGDEERIEELGIERLYLRVFDVQVKKGEPKPASTVDVRAKLPEGTEVIPTVYITVETVRSLERYSQADTLADRIGRKVGLIMEEIGRADYPELQIDCDWTASTQTLYFHLLDRLRATLPDSVLLSATIRLHQIKFAERTGIPPVDRGLLMVYNTGDVTDPDEANAILRSDVVDDYIADLDDYPLPLDVALPIFSWGVRFHFDRFAELIPDLDADAIERSGLARPVDDNHWLVERSGRLGSAEVTASDIIRVEETPPHEVLPVARTIAARLAHPPRSVVLYRYDPIYFDRYAPTSLDSLYRTFE